MASLSLLVKARTTYSATFVDAAVSTSADTVTVPGHGLREGDTVRFTNSGGALPGGLTSGTVYYVVSPTATTFKVSTTSGGSAVNISSAAGGGTHTVTRQTPFDDIVTAESKTTMANVLAYLKGVAGGASDAAVDFQQDPADPVAASGTFTLASVQADDAVTIGTVTLTGKASPSGENQWATGGADDTADAVTLAAAINAHSVLGKVVTASSADAVVTVTCKVKGVVGNQIPTSETGTTITVSGTFLTGGTGGHANAATSFNFGK
jgi:hypothetical protein